MGKHGPTTKHVPLGFHDRII